MEGRPGRRPHLRRVGAVDRPDRDVVGVRCAAAQVSGCRGQDGAQAAAAEVGDGRSAERRRPSGKRLDRRRAQVGHRVDDEAIGRGDVDAVPTRRIDRRDRRSGGEGLGALARQCQREAGHRVAVLIDGVEGPVLGHVHDLTAAVAEQVPHRRRREGHVVGGGRVAGMGRAVGVETHDVASDGLPCGLAVIVTGAVDDDLAAAEVRDRGRRPRHLVDPTPPELLAVRPPDPVDAAVHAVSPAGVRGGDDVKLSAVLQVCQGGGGKGAVPDQLWPAGNRGPIAEPSVGVLVEGGGEQLLTAVPVEVAHRNRAEEAGLDAARAVQAVLGPTRPLHAVAVPDVHRPRVVVDDDAGEGVAVKDRDGGAARHPVGHLLGPPRHHLVVARIPGVDVAVREGGHDLLLTVAEQVSDRRRAERLCQFGLALTRAEHGAADREVVGLGQRGSGHRRSPRFRRWRQGGGAEHHTREQRGNSKAASQHGESVPW